MVTAGETLIMPSKISHAVFCKGSVQNGVISSFSIEVKFKPRLHSSSQRIADSEYFGTYFYIFSNQFLEALQGKVFFDFPWKKEYAGLQPAQAKRLEELEKDNGRLKKLLAEVMLDKLKDINSSNF